MENLLRVKLDSFRKRKAAQVFSKNNLSLSNAVRLLVNRSIENDGIPFSLLMPKESDMDRAGIEALRKMQIISEMNGNSKMTLDDINAEISAARKGVQ